MERKYFTRQGYENHMKKISELEKKLDALQHQVQDALEMGGDMWHDNFSYDEITRLISMGDRRLNDAYALIKGAEIVSYPASVKHVMLGSEARVLLDGNEETFKIVAYGESDHEKNQVLYAAPLAQAMIGHNIGDVIEAEIGDRTRQIKILGLKPLNGKITPS